MRNHHAYGSSLTNTASINRIMTRATNNLFIEAQIQFIFTSFDRFAAFIYLRGQWNVR